MAREEDSHIARKIFAAHVKLDLVSDGNLGKHEEVLRKSVFSWDGQFGGTLP